MFCVKCGNKVYDNGNFCNMCGHEKNKPLQVSAPKQSSVTQYQHPSVSSVNPSKQSNIKTQSILALLGIIAFIFPIFTNQLSGSLSNNNGSSILSSIFGNYITVPSYSIRPYEVWKTFDFFSEKNYIVEGFSFPYAIILIS